MDLKNMTNLSSDGANLSKIIATFCVVLTHSYKLFKYMNVLPNQIFWLRGIHAFASSGVPVFFLLSGYFLVYKESWNYCLNLKKKIHSLVVPYISFILIYALISIIGSLVVPAFFDNFRCFNAYDWIMHLIGIPFVVAPIYYGPLWFLRELFILNVFAFVLVPIVKKVPGYIIIPAMITVYFLPLSQMVRYSIPLFVLGMHFGFCKKIPIIDKTTINIMIFLCAFFIPILFEGDLSWKTSVFLMTILILAISEKLVYKDIFSKISKSAISFSFPIYLLHEYPITTLMRLLALKKISIPMATVVFLIAPFLVIALCVIVIIFWRRLLPRSFSLFTGGRY